MTYTQISAGGVVYRHHEGALQIQLILDRYGKTSLPKGKMEAGETVEQTALREICEETGIVGSITSQWTLLHINTIIPSSARWTRKFITIWLRRKRAKPQIEEINGVDWFEPLAAWRKQRSDGYNNNDIILRKALTLLRLAFLRMKI